MATYEEYKSFTADSEIGPGDVVAVKRGGNHHEGIVIRSFIDFRGRQILEVQLETNEIHQAWYPTVTRVRRTVSYSRPPPILKQRTVERQIYW